MLKITLCIAWAPLLLLYLRGVYIRLPFIGQDNYETAIVVSVVLPIICSLPAIINRFCLIDYLFYIINVFYLLSCYVFFPENKPYLDEYVLFCCFNVFPYYFVGRLLDIENFFKTLIILSVICIFADIYYYLIFSPQNRGASEGVLFDNMYGAYLALPHVALMMWATLEKFRIWKALITVIGILFLLSCGTRGTFVCLGVFGIIYFFFYMKFKGAIYVKIGIISAFALLIATLNSTMYYIAQFFTDFNLSTRILEKFVEGDLGNDSSRSILRAKLEHVMENGDHFWGLGAFGCRNYNIVYPHFLPLDFAVTYGYFIGYILLFLLLALFLYALWLSRGSKRQIFIIYMFSISIIKLLISNTFLQEPYFYMFIGVCVTEIIINNETHHVSFRDAPGSH